MSPSRALSFPGRRRQRAAGERIAGLFEEHSRMIYGVCRLLLRDSVEAEDASQQTFLSAYRGLLAGQEPREPSAWLGTIARNECRTRLRARRTEPLTLVVEPLSDDLQREVGRREEISALCTALAELPQQQRDAIVLREFYGLSYTEVAAALGLSGAAVESLLFRSRKRLQEQLRPLRAALGVLTVPISLRDSLAQALPGFGGAGASAGAGAAVLAKVGSVPVAAKIAAATLAVGAAGTFAGVETQHAVLHHRAPAPAKHAAAVHNVAAVAPVAPASLVRIGFTTASSAGKPEGEHKSSAPEGSDKGATTEQHSGSESEAQQQEPAHSGSSHDGGSEQEQAKPPEPEHSAGSGGESAPQQTTTTGGGGSGDGSGDTHHDSGSGGGGEPGDGGSGSSPSSGD